MGFHVLYQLQAPLLHPHFLLLTLESCLLAHLTFPTPGFSLSWQRQHLLLSPMRSVTHWVLSIPLLCSEPSLAP